MSVGNLKHCQTDRQYQHCTLITYDVARVAGLSAHVGKVSLSSRLSATKIPKGTDLSAGVLAHGKALVCASDHSEWGLRVARQCIVGEPETADSKCGKSWVKS